MRSADTRLATLTGLSPPDTQILFLSLEEITIYFLSFISEAQTVALSPRLENWDWISDSEVESETNSQGTQAKAYWK